MKKQKKKTKKVKCGICNKEIKNCEVCGAELKGEIYSIGVFDTCRHFCKRCYNERLLCELLKAYSIEQVIKGEFFKEGGVSNNENNLKVGKCYEMG